MTSGRPMKGEMALSGSGTQLELFVRSSAPVGARERQTAMIERLRALDDIDSIGATAVRTWEKRIPIGEDRFGESETHRAYAAFTEWARGRDIELRPFFDTRECHSAIIGGSHTALVLPVMCLAVHEGDRLRSVFPHTRGDLTHTVGDALAALETNESDQLRRSALHVEVEA